MFDQFRPRMLKLFDGRIRGLASSGRSGNRVGVPVTIGPGLKVGLKVGVVNSFGLKVGFKVGQVGLGTKVGLRVGRCGSGSAALLDLLRGGRVGLYPGRVGLYPGVGLLVGRRGFGSASRFPINFSLLNATDHFDRSGTGLPVTIGLIVAGLKLAYCANDDTSEGFPGLVGSSSPPWASGSASLLLRL